MIRLLIPLALVATLSGCDVKSMAYEIGKKFEQQAQEQLNEKDEEHSPMTLVFRSGTKLTVGGRAVQVHGDDLCPPSEGLTRVLYGPAPDEGQRDCMIIEPDTRFVSVRVAFPEGPTTEDWTVERSGMAAILRRADGSLIGF